MHELADVEQAPVGVLVERLARDDRARMSREVLGVHAQRVAAGVQRPVAVRAARLALQHEQPVRLGVAERPEPVRRREDQVDRIDRDVLGDPVGRPADAGAHIAAVRVDVLGDEREHALRVGVAEHELAVAADLRLQLVEPGDGAVVGHDAPVHLERMRVLRQQRAGRREPHVRDERRRADVVHLAREGRVLEGGHRLLVEHGRAVGLVEADTRAVGVAPALDGEAVRRFQQPEAGVDAMRGGGESKESAHMPRIVPHRSAVTATAPGAPCRSTRPAWADTPGCRRRPAWRGR